MSMLILSVFFPESSCRLVAVRFLNDGILKVWTFLSQLLKSHEMHAEWMEHDECLKLDCSSRHTAFVVDHFDGNAFQHLMHLSCRCGSRDLVLRLPTCISPYFIYVGCRLQLFEFVLHVSFLVRGIFPLCYSEYQ